MRLRMTETREGSEDGIHSRQWKEGETYDISDPLASIFLKEGWAERVDTPEARETKPAGPAETKPAGPSEMKRSYASSGSWKTLYQDGAEVGKVQASADDAQAWVQGDVTLDDLA